MKKINYFKGLLNAIVNIEDLEVDVQKFKQKYEEESEILYADLISILTKIAHYFKELEDLEEQFTPKQVEDSANALIGLYKQKHKAKELSGKELNKFRELINIILVALDYYPLDEDGEESDDDFANTFDEEVYNKF